MQMQTLSKPVFLKPLYFGLITIPAIILGLLVLKYGVNVPYMDQWYTPVHVLVKVSQGNLSFSDLIEQHNESRIFFPRLLFIGLAYLTDWNVRYEMLVTFMLACIVSYNICYLSRVTVGSNLKKWLILAFISNLLIFSPMQWENWLWGIQLIVFVPIACITTCMVIAYSRLSNLTKLIGCILLSTLSTFSYANGILCWIIVFPVLYLSLTSFPDKLNKQKWFVLVWIAAFALNAILYFYNYKKPASHPSFLEPVAHPLKSLSYFLSFVGAPLGFGNLLAGQILGALLLLLFCFACLYLLKYWQNLSLVLRLNIWLMIGAYTIISGLITTIGRVGFGIEQSLSSRYTTFSVYLTISVIYSVAIILEYLQQEYQIELFILRFLAALGVIVLLGLHLLSFAHGIHLMAESNRNRLYGKSCLLFINIVKEKECLRQKIYPNLEYLEQKANQINKMDFLEPNLLTHTTIEYIDSENNNGWFEKIDKGSMSTEYIASGWITVAENQKQADAVILTYENQDGKHIVFAVAKVGSRSSDVFHGLNEDVSRKVQWHKLFSIDNVPVSSGKKITAWAFDVNTSNAFKLQGNPIIE